MRKRIISALLIAFMLLTMLPTVSFAITDSANYAYVYVAPDGNDAAAGTIDAPLATMAGARNKVREMKKAGNIPSKGIVVYFRGGDYGLTENITFTSEDSGSEGAPVVYRSYPGEKAVFVGGAPISLDKVQPVTDAAILNRIIDEEARSQVVMINLKQQGFHDLGEPYRVGAYSYQTSYGFPSAPSAPAMEFFADGELMTLARYPNNGYITIKEVLREGYYKRQDESMGDPMAGIEITTDDKRFEKWLQAPDALVLGYWYYDWAESSMMIKRINLGKGSIETDWSHCYGVIPNQRFYAYNLLEEIDVPGEYYIDRKNGILYFYPLKPLDQTKDLKMSVLDEDLIWITDKAEYIEFKDLKFTAARCSVMDLSNCSHINVIGCEFEYTADYAIDMMYPDEPGTSLSDPPVKHCLIKNCYFHDVDGGITSYSGHDKTLEYTYNVFENNTFDNFSRISKTYTAAISLYGNGQVARYNEMMNAPHLAIIFGGQDNRIEYNDIHNVVKEGDDSAAIYGGQTITGRGLQIRYNYIHDIKSDSGQGVGRAAVYLDGGQNQVTMMGNVVNNIEGSGFWLNGGQNNYVYNNIMINVEDGGVYFSDIMSEAGVRDEMKERLRSTAEEYLKNPLWRERYPELIAQLENKDTTFYPMNCMIQNNVTVNSNLMKYYGAAASYVNLKGNFNAKSDPGFYDASKGNFLLKPDSQVYKEIPDFNPIPFTRMGTYSDRALQRVKDAVVLAIGSPFARNKGKDTKIDANNLMVAPFVEDGTTFVPVRFVAEALGAKVDYNGATREVTISNGSDTLVLTIDSLTAKKNGEATELVKAPRIVEGRTLLPLRNVAELLGKEVFWDNCGLIVVSEDAGLFSETSDEEIIGYLYEYLDIH